jgi:mRNA-degrading endonuclease RelE of RelBE toxin-antitoxin system
MSKKVIWNDPAQAQLRAIDRETALHILHALARYMETGEGDVKRLQNIEPPEFRLGVGDYRVRFHDQGDALRITAVKHRREAYRRLAARRCRCARFAESTRLHPAPAASFPATGVQTRLSLGAVERPTRRAT